MGAATRFEPGLTSIVVPTYNHATYLPDAIASALAQTAPVEVIVVDDGSTDDTAEVLERAAHRITILRRVHEGPSAARNAGLDAATGEFVMFLDADDVIDRGKVARQVLELQRSPEAGWVLCDVLIDDEVKGRKIQASQQYQYKLLGLSGWIDKALARANFIPIMSPLVRRTVLGDIRFDDQLVPEDWYFWQAVAQVARVRYVDEVLATYRHRRTGRSRLPKRSRAVVPNVVAPLRLNLGCGTPGTRSWHPIDGLVNLDKSMGWQFEDGLGEFADGSVAGITISHALMYLAAKDWPMFFAEVTRVLTAGGVVRVTEDETENPASTRVGGWKGSQPAVTMTTPAWVSKHLTRAGLEVHHVDQATTRYRDQSLCQAQHGAPPDVFFIEGVKPSRVLFSPHHDDETLFAAFTILRYRPRVVVCFPSVRDYGDPEVRAQETTEAMRVLGASGVEHWEGTAIEARMRTVDAERQPTVVWAPHPRTSHPDHQVVAAAARAVFGDRVRFFHTYDASGKVRQGQRVEPEVPWIAQKLRALLRYETQLAHPRASAFFLADLDEFTEE